MQLRVHSPRNIEMRYIHRVPREAFAPTSKDLGRGAISSNSIVATGNILDAELHPPILTAELLANPGISHQELKLRCVTERIPLLLEKVDDRCMGYDTYVPK